MPPVDPPRRARISADIPPEPRYPWVRCWIPAAIADEEGIEGFFLDPELRRANYLPEIEAHTLDQLAEVPCLVLLGEPGLGKSRAVHHAVRRLEQQADVCFRYYDLGQESETTAIRAGLAEHRSWREWADEGKIFYLFLDSFDEALLRLPVVHKAITAEIAQAGDAISRLRLRVVSRSADWLPEFSAALRELWGGHADVPEPVHRMLAPLTRDNAAQAAEIEGIDSDEFLATVAAQNVEAMAAVPLTLKMMIDAAKEPEGLPDSRTELFRRSASRLALEHDTARRRDSAFGSLDANQRVAVAERLAAASLLSACPVFALESGLAQGADIEPGEVSGFHEQDPRAAGVASFRVTPDVVREVLSTALFAGRGPGRVAFHHRGLAEYLAAAYLRRYDLDAEQTASVLVAADDEEGRVIPQLREVAAWLAVLGGEAGQEVLRRDPAVALRADRLQLGDEETTRLVDALLSEPVAERLELRYDRRTEANYTSLKHPGLVEQLRSALHDTVAPGAGRRLALSIARAVQLEELIPDLVTVAHRETEDPYQRAEAVRALGEYAAEADLERLIPLATDRIEADVDDDIKGSALDATYPKVLSVQQVLPVLTKPRNKALIGTYSMFLAEFPGRLRDSELVAALTWAADRVEPEEPDDEVGRMIDGVIERAWPRISDERIATRVAQITVRRLLRSDDLIRSGIRRRDPEWGAYSDAEGRHHILEHLIDEISDDPDQRDAIHPRHLPQSRPALVDRGDLNWLLDRFEANLGTDREARWAGLAEAAVDPEAPGIDRLWELAQAHTSLGERVNHWFAPIRLDSEIADLLRKGRGEPEEISDDAPDMDAEILTALERAERGEPEAFTLVNYALGFGPRGQARAHDPFNADITSTPGWKRATDDIRSRIGAVARSFLEAVDPEPEDWFGTNSVPWVVIAGYRALFLLAEARPTELGELPAKLWKRWVPVVVGFPHTQGGENDDKHSAIMRAALAATPQDVTGWAIRSIDHDSAKGDGYLFTLSRVGEFDIPELTQALLTKLADPALKPRGLDLLVRWGLERDPERVLDAVEPRVAPEVALSGSEERERAKALAATLLAASPMQGWERLQRLAEADRDLAREIVQEVADREVGDLAVALDDNSLARFVEMMFDLFPPEEDPDPPTEAAYRVTAREGAGDLRRRLLSILAERGTSQSYSAVKRIVDERGVPNGRWFREVAWEARLSRWRVPEPRDVVALAHTNDGRIVLSGDHLQSLVLASLRRIQSRIATGEPPMAFELWNEDLNRPLPEERLSNWLIHRLRDDLKPGGRVIHREVQVAPGAKPAGRGKSTDIQVTVPLGEYIEGAPIATVILEVKGAWNSQVGTMVSEQLVRRYLTVTGIRHGVGVVFWFPREGWDASDWRREKGVRAPDRLQSRLDEQVAAAPDGYQVGAMVLNGTRPKVT